MWKVGQLAKRTGISVRTLHHYDQIGLLTPSHRTESGHRLYDRDDVVRLQQIVMLRQLGFALDEIGVALRSADTSLPRLIEMHLARLRGQIERERRLCARLEQMSAWLRAEMQRGTDVNSPQVQALAKRWMSLVNEFSGGDAAIETSVSTMYRSEPGAAERFGFDMKVFEYIKPALKK